jgi:hypothetical protein
MNIRIRNLGLREIILVILTGVAIGISTVVRGTDYLGLTVTLLLFFILIVSFFYFTKDRSLIYILVFSLTFRMILAIVNVYIIPLPGGEADAIAFERVGWEYVELWNQERTSVSRNSGAFLYSVWVGILYLIFDRLPIIPHVFNAITGTVTVYLIYNIAFRITESSKVAKVAGIIAMLFPTLNLFSAILLRESFIVFFFSFSLYLFLVWYYDNKVNLLLMSFVLLFAATSLHGGFIFIALIYIIYALFYQPKFGKWVFSMGRSIFVFISLGTIILIFGSYIFHQLPSFSMLTSPEFFANWVNVASRDTAAYLPGYAPRNLLDVLIQTPVRIIYFLFSPFPWMISSQIHIIGAIDALIYFALFCFSIKGFILLWKYDKSLCILVFSILVITVVVFSWGTSNFGTALRHRQKIVPIFIIMAAIGIRRKILLNLENDKKLGA